MKLLRRSSTDELVTCGCCERKRPLRVAHELGGTPGVYICRTCAAWVVGRTLRGKHKV